jgi:hypothetical protein
MSTAKTSLQKDLHEFNRTNVLRAHWDLMTRHLRAATFPS